MSPGSPKGMKLEVPEKSDESSDLSDTDEEQVTNYLL
jgi:hypothetical protein